MVIEAIRAKAAVAVVVAAILALSSCGGSDRDAPGGEGATETGPSADAATDEGFAAGPPRPGVYLGSGSAFEGFAEATDTDDEIRIVVEPASSELPFGRVTLIEADCAGRRFEVQPETRRPEALTIEAEDVNDEPVNSVEDAESFNVSASLSEGITESFSDTELSLEDIVGGREPSHIRWSVRWSSTESVIVMRRIFQEHESFQCYWQATWQSEE